VPPTGVDFEAFFAQHYAPVVRALAWALRDRAAAEDAAQEAFAKAYRKWGQVGRFDRPEGWVYVVAARDARRRLARLERLEQRVADTRPPAGVVDPEFDDLGPLLASLTARQRVAVVLRYWGDLDEASMAEAMGCARGTVKATLAHALGKLRVQVEQQEVSGAH